MQNAIENASGVNGAVTAASSVTATLSTMGTQISSAASKLDQADPKGELDQAFKDAPACKSLTSLLLGIRQTGPCHRACGRPGRRSP